MEVFERHLRVQFARWRDNTKHRDDEAQGISKLMIKYQRRQKRIFFQQYLLKAQNSKEEQRDVIRGKEAREKLRNRLVARTFKLLVRNMQHSFQAKESLIRVMKQRERRLEDQSFRTWVKYNEFQREKALEKVQNDTVQNIKSLTGEIGKLLDQVEVQNQYIVSLNYIKKQTCHRLIAQYIKRFEYMTEQFYFQRWAQTLKVEKRTRNMILNAFSHYSRSSLSFAFHRWVQHGSIFVTQSSIKAILQSENKIIQNVTREIKEAAHLHESQVFFYSQRLQKTETECQILQAKHSKCLAVIIDRVQSNHHMLKLRYILEQWRSFVKGRKRCVIALEVAIKKTLWQIGFTGIRYYWKEFKNSQRRQRITQRFIAIFTKHKYRVHFHQWIAQCHAKANQFTSITSKQTQLLLKEHSKLVRVIHDRAESQLIQHREHTLKFDCFVGWRSQITLDKAFRLKTISLQKSKLERDREAAIQLWRARSMNTQKLRNASVKGNEKYKRKLAQLSWESWVEYVSRQKKFCRALSNLANKVDAVFIKRTFHTIHQHSESNNTMSLYNKFKSCQFFMHALQPAHDHRMRSYFIQIREVGIHLNQNQMAARSIIKHWVSQKLRLHISQWKEEAQRKSVKNFCTNEGPVAIEIHLLQKRLYALKLLCLEEGIDEVRIQQILATAKAKNIENYMRVISRLLCNSDTNLRLVPYSFDRWRQWLKFRRSYSHYLKFTNNFLNSKLKPLSQAFNTWKNLENDLETELDSGKLKDLKEVSIGRDDRVGQLAIALEERGQDIDDLSTQRSLLLMRYVGSQKLAFGSIHAQNQRAKSKAFSLWLSQNKRAEKKKIEHILKQNLLRINAFKERILFLETANLDMADQNAELRQGALDGLEMAKNLDEINRERELINIDMAEKAQVIRRLLEDNANLHHQLTHAQEHAQQLILHTQNRLLNY